MGSILNSATLAAAVAAATLIAAPSAYAADAGAGAKLFASQCGVCHTHAAGARSGVGPNLFGIVGRHAGTLPGFHYSSAMKNSGITWTPQELSRYIASPSQTVHGNHMPYGGLHNASKVGDLLAYLETLK